MKTSIHHKDRILVTDLSQPIDISIPLHSGADNVNAWYLPPPQIGPVIDGEFTGSVKAGASTNFNTIKFNPHAHGTHTECFGHITTEFYAVNDLLKNFMFTARLISLTPEKANGDLVITREQLESKLKDNLAEALVIRTLPNEEDKLTKQYSHSNPPYLDQEAATCIREWGIQHLLVDLPSVDKEKDEGKLAAHRAFWDMDGDPRTDATITELIYVPNEVPDGEYLLNLQIAPFVNDASPSKPILYKIMTHEDNH